MKVFLLLVLFNIHTGIQQPAIMVDDPKNPFDTPQECFSAAIERGISTPDKDGNIKLYVCGIPDEDKPKQII